MALAGERAAMGGPMLLWSLGRLHWGFIVRQLGASAAQLAYPIPPPTTVAGAFMAALGRVLGLREKPLYRDGVIGYAMRCALRATLAASAGLAAGYAASYEEPSRLVGAGYKSGSSYESAVKQPPYLGMQEVMPVQAVGAAAALDSLLALAWAFDPGRLAGCLGVERGDVEAAAGEAALLVHRVGSREGLYSAVAGGVGGEGLGEASIFESILYQRAACASPLSGNVARLQLPSPPDYMLEEYLAPAGPLGGSVMLTAPVSPAVFEASRGCSVLEARVEVEAGGRRVEAALGLAYPSPGR